jgi:nitrate reductase delta subunit
MRSFETAIPKMTYTLRALAWLLRYPDGELRAAAPHLAAALVAEGALHADRIVEIEVLTRQFVQAAPLRIEAEYVELFDRGRRTALHLFEHVHGDSRDRGPAMINLAQTYERAGLLLVPGELPDYLPAVLEFASTQPPVQAREFLREIAHIVRAIFSALLERGSPYASVLAAVLDLAGEQAQKVPLAAEPGIDETWAEPEAFGGCHSQGQDRPGEAQPIHVVRARPAPRATA